MTTKTRRKATTTRAGTSNPHEGGRAPRDPRVARLRRRRVQRRRRQRLPRARRQRTLGDRALAVTADSPSYPERHRRLAIDIAQRFGLRHEIIRTGELERADYRANPENRCYFCKHELYTHLVAYRERTRTPSSSTATTPTIAATTGPAGRRRASSACAARSTKPDLTKDEIRELSRVAGLPTWDEPASACLSSRIPYHSEVTDEKLRMIERAEQAIARAGIPRLPRAPPRRRRPRRDRARRNLPRALEPAMSAAIVRELNAIGYGRSRSTHADTGWAASTTVCVCAV